MSDSIVLGGGCFWCLEAAYQEVKGVTRVVPGYSGGTVVGPTYEQVCNGSTGHAEVVRVTYDQTITTLENLMAIFWLIHDPTSLNQQGPDVGSQYASVVFYESEAQEPVIARSQAQAQLLLADPIVTRVTPLAVYYEAEAYHHNYFNNHPEAAYCQAVITPKLQKLRHHFSSLVND